MARALLFVYVSVCVWNNDIINNDMSIHIGDDFWDVDTLKRMDKVSHYFYSSHLLVKARERKS